MVGHTRKSKAIFLLIFILLIPIAVKAIPVVEIGKSSGTSSGSGTYIVNANVNDSYYWSGHAYSNLISQWSNDAGYVTSAGSGAFNATYQGYFTTYGSYWYNHTSEVYNAWNTLWLSTFNSTYDNILRNPITFNATYEAGLGGGSSFNVTYQTWTLINQTLGAINYCDARIAGNNSAWLSTFNSTYEAGLGGGGAFNITYQNKSAWGTCPAGQVIQNTSANGVQCVTAGSSTTTTLVTGQPLVIRQLAQLSTNNNTVWSPTDLAFTIEPNRKHTMECDILFAGDAATTGMVINWTTNITTQNVNNVYATWSSATAPVVISGNIFEAAMTGTGSGATIIQPSKFYSDFNSISGGDLRMYIRSEVAGSNTVIHRGSTCKLYNRENYTTTPVSDPTGWYPATAWQGYDDTTNNATTQWNNTMLNFTLNTGKKYNLDCNLLMNATISTTGLVLNLTTTATTSNVNIVYNTWSSGVAPVVISATAFETALTGTGSAAANTTASKLYADFETTSAGTLKLMYRSEVALSNVTMRRGSVCRLYDVT